MSPGPTPFTLFVVFGIAGCTSLAPDSQGPVDGGQDARAQEGGAVADGSIDDARAARDASADDDAATGDGGPSAQAMSCANCDPVASCDSTVSPVACTCPDTHEGEGPTCAHKCDLAECDAHATCTVVAGAARCACSAPYVGDGATCEFDAECSLLGCHPDANCVSTGTERKCECRDGFSGDGVNTCTNEDDCASAPCERGSCVDGVADYTCNCPVGYSGKNCQVDQCAPSPCDSGFSCTRSASGPVCTPDCAPNCTAGEACTDSAHCAGSSSCGSAGICLVEGCGGRDIVFQQDIDALRYCRSISGGLQLTMGDYPSRPTEFVLPHLESITGSIVASGFEAPHLTLIELPRLVTVGGDFTVAVSQSLTKVSAPRLATVSGDFQAVMTSASVFNFAALNAAASVAMTGDYVSQLVLGPLDQVQGEINLSYFLLVAWSQLMGYQGKGTSSTFQDIGCAVCPASASNRYMCAAHNEADCP